MIDPRIASRRDRVWKASVIRSKIRSRVELNWLCLCFCTLHTNEIPRTDTLVQGRLRARRGFGYWSEQIGHLRDRSGHHFGTRRQNSSLQPRVGVETTMAIGSTQAARVRSHERFRRMGVAVPSMFIR